MKLKKIIIVSILALTLTGCDVRIVLDPFGMSGNDSQESSDAQSHSRNNNSTNNKSLRNTLPGYGQSIHTNPNNSMIGR